MRLVPGIASTIVLVLVALFALPMSASALASTPPPSRCGIAELAPILSDDGVDEALPQSDWVPVIMVHGWLGTATHDEARDGAFSGVVDGTSSSLIGMTQNIPGAAVYTFDYRALAARWVTDPGIGDALAETIRCVTRASGHQAVVVAHSMGGLAARQALSRTLDGVAVADLVSTVVTFGTPNTGSALASVLAGSTGVLDALTPGGLLLGGRFGLTALLQLCGADFSKDVVSARGCSGIPTVDAFASQAGAALRSGSAEIGALAPWPARVHVISLAGDVRLPLLEIAERLFGLPAPSGETVSVGDIIVGTDSAASGVDERHVVTCPGSMMAGFEENLCQHANLMRNPVLATWAIAEVRDAVAAERPEATAVGGMHAAKGARNGRAR